MILKRLICFTFYVAALFVMNTLKTMTQLHRATLDGDLVRVKKSIAAGMDLDQANYLASPPLHYASQNGHESIVLELISAYANVNAVDRAKRTALHWAASLGYKNIISLLLSAGADITACDKDGMMPFDVAKNEKIYYFLAYLARPQAQDEIKNLLFATHYRIGAESSAHFLIQLPAEQIFHYLLSS